MQLARHAAVCNEDNQRLTRNCLENVNLSNRYGNTNKRFSKSYLNSNRYGTDTPERLGQANTASNSQSQQPPVHSATNRTGPKTREFEEARTDKILADNIIKPAQTEWASPILFAPVEDGTLHFCVAFWKLNAVTKRDSHPIAQMDEYIDSIGEDTIFSTQDISSGYWQIEIDEADRNKTAFISHRGLHKFIRMLFGLRNTPGTFQGTMDGTLSTVK